MSDGCNITSTCNNPGYSVYFENGTTGSIFNCSATINADNFYFDDAGSGSWVATDTDCYFNTT
jgi:hypothetical protein